MTAMPPIATVHLLRRRLQQTDTLAGAERLRAVAAGGRKLRLRVRPCHRLRLVTLTLMASALPAFPTDLGRRFAGSFLVDIGAKRHRFPAGKDQRSGSADATPCTGDDDGLFRKIVWRLRHSFHNPNEEDRLLPRTRGFFNGFIYLVSELQQSGRFRRKRL